MKESNRLLISRRGLLQVGGATVLATAGSVKESNAVSLATIPAGTRSLSGRVKESAGQSSRGVVLAVHGGGYTSKYFDVPGQSAMEFIASLGYHVVAVDRPGHGATTDWLLDFDDQAKVLAEVADWSLKKFGASQDRVFLYGHSIGGMISLLAANANPSRYLGVSMTGSGATYHERALSGLNARLADPATVTHTMSPEAARRAVFMGPAWSYDMEVTKLDPGRDVPSLVADLRGAVAWPERLKREAAQARVPVQFVIPEYDGLWRPDSIQGVRDWFSGVPFADVYVQRNAGHSVELHHIWRAHVMKIIAFAEECCVQQEKTAGLTPK